MSEKTSVKCRMSPGVRFALCVAIGASLSVSNNPATGIAVAAGPWLMLTLSLRS